MNATAAPFQLADDDFAVFRLPRRFGIDAESLDARRRELQTLVHPDRYVAGDAAAQRLATQWSVRVNEAYRRLRDPVLRAAYLCELGGAAVRAEQNTSMPHAFLMQQLQWREALEEADGASAIHALLAQVDAERLARLARVRALLDDVHDATAAADEVRALMFLDRFKSDVEQRLDGLG